MGSLSPSIVEKKASQSLPAFEEGAVTAPSQSVKGCKRHHAALPHLVRGADVGQTSAPSHHMPHQWHAHAVPTLGRGSAAAVARLTASITSRCSHAAKRNSR